MAICWPFLVIFCQLHETLSQNWGHFEVLNTSKAQLDQKLQGAVHKLRLREEVGRWSKNGHLWVINFQYFFFQNWKKNGNKKTCVLSCSFWSNWALDAFSTSKWMSALKFCERYICSWQKKWPERVLKRPNSKVVFFEQNQTIHWKTTG